MTTAIRFHLLACLLGAVLVTPACTVPTAPPQAGAPAAAAAAPQRQFASPDDAVKALLAAAQANDRPAELRERLRERGAVVGILHFVARHQIPAFRAENFAQRRPVVGLGGGPQGLHG